MMMEHLHNDCSDKPCSHVCPECRGDGKQWPALWVVLFVLLLMSVIVVSESLRYKADGQGLIAAVAAVR